MKVENTKKLAKFKQDQDDAINSLVTKDDIERVYKRFKEFASFEELEKHKKTIEPLVNLCR